jgi:D-serine deaminase-like pyridoxal phosphate-dependent protein
VQVEKFLSTARDLIVAELGSCPVISSGGTPSMAQAALAPCITEYRAGTYIYNDRSLVERGACQITDCALTVLATVVSRPTPDRAVLDAGSKTLSSDLFGLQGYGMILEHPEATITALSEEHGNVTLHGASPGPKVGDKVRVVPNHSCVVSNLTDRVVFHRGGEVLRHEDVAARGCVV